ncbi:MAG: hypothetical protein EOO01_41850, partial [Chitinophagaceae bacterium]
MKKNIIAAAAIVFALASCKEVGPAIDLSPVVASDTTFMSSPETPQQKKVLVEEYTGVQCTNCPEGAGIIKDADDLSGGRVIVIGLHSGSLTSPIENESQYDFRTQDSRDLMISFFGEDPPKPAAAFDRVRKDGAIFNNKKGEWSQ